MINPLLGVLGSCKLSVFSAPNRVSGSGFRVQGLGFGVQGLGFRGFRRSGDPTCTLNPEP